MIPLAITGTGILSALGIGAEATFARLADASAGFTLEKRPLKSFDASKVDAPLFEVPDFEPAKFLGDKGLRTLDRLTKLLVVASRLSLEDAGLKRAGAFTALSSEQVGVCCSNAYGSLEAITELDRVAVLEDPRYINPAKFPNTVSNSAAGYISIWEELRALNVSVSDGNCGALDAVFAASLFLATSRADAILTGGGEAMSEALYVAFERLGAFANGAASPRLAEGAAFFALELVGKAALRGARTLGLVFGYGTAFVAPAPEVTLLHASKDALARAIRAALADGAIGADDVDVVVSGEAGLAAFDEAEAAAIEETLGERAVLAPKKLLGETLGAGGALGIAAALAALRDGAPLATLVRGTAPARRRTALVTALGYHGNASALLVRAAS